MQFRAVLYTVAITVMISLAGCSRRPEIGPVIQYTPECLILRGAAPVSDSITVLLPGAVGFEHAPNPANPGEQLLFRHLYETLITVDCREDVRPCLAGSWSGGNGGRCWTFELREGAKFWDGAPLKAQDVASSWRQISDGEPATIAGIESTTVTGDKILHVYTKHPYRSVPRVLALPEFAVAKWVPDAQWPIGSGPYSIASYSHGSLGPFDSGPFDSGPFDIVIDTRPTSGVEGPVIRFVGTTISDTRDLLGKNVDLLATADPAVIEYASSLPNLATIPLPWDKTYVLLSPSRVRALSIGGKISTLSPVLLDGLARDAVRCEARGHNSSSWWEDSSTCQPLRPAMPIVPASPHGETDETSVHRIVFDIEDPAARELAERIVALSGADPATTPGSRELASAVPGLVDPDARTTLEGVTRHELDKNLRNGDDFAYVIPIPGQPIDPCYAIREMMNRAPWLMFAGRNLARAFIPLVDTRRYVIADKNRIGLMRDSRGGILITNGLLPER